jgi:hypothetical protein
MKRDYGDDDLLKDQEGWCEVCSVDYRKMKGEINKLNENIIALGEHILGEYGKEKSTWKAIKLILEELHDGREYWNCIFTLASSEEIKTRPQEKSLLDLFDYLLLVEGIYSRTLKILLLLLVESHHDLYDPIRNDFVSSSEQIEKIDLSIKLKFLRKHGFGLVVDSVDRKLRNDIAHLNFRVMTDGKIVDKRNGIELTDLGERVLRLRWICTLVGCTFEYLFWKCKDPSYY